MFGKLPILMIHGKNYRQVCLWTKWFKNSGSDKCSFSDGIEIMKIN